MNNLNIFKKLHHICIVVNDMESSVQYYESIGVGPWTDFPSLENFQVDGIERDAFLGLRYKYANLDNVQIQLCQPGSGDTPQGQFLRTRGEGVFHLGFDVVDCDIAEVDAVQAGLAVKARGRLPNRSGFTYFETVRQGAGVTLEVRAVSVLS